jgi:hypothetical protein
MKEPAAIKFLGVAQLMSDTNVYQRIKLHVNNARGGQMIKVYVSKGDSPVAWSSGPAFETDSSINIISSSGGIVPLRVAADRKLTH